MQPFAKPPVKTPAAEVTPALSSQATFLALLKSMHRGDIRQVASVVLSRGIDFVDLSNFLIEEKLGVYFYSLVLDLEIQVLFPRDFLSQIGQQHLQQQHRNRQLVRGLQELDTAFAREKIDFLLLKGLHVAELAWKGMDHRFTWDLDLLVRQKCWRQAVNILTGMGFRKPPWVLGLDRFVQCFSHAMALDRPEGTSLDLHWTFRKLPGIRVNLDTIWSRSTTFRIGELECRVPGNESLLSLMLLGIADDKNRDKGNLRSYWDIYLLLQKMTKVNWRMFLDDWEGECMLPLIVNSLDLVFVRLDCRNEFPDLAGVLESFDDILLSGKAPAAPFLPAWLRQKWVSRWWFARLQPNPLWYYALWWLLTFPMRFLLNHSR